jgi:thioredoxin reductase (NADPH)
MSNPKRQVILYTQTGCEESRKVRQWLTDRDIAFAERNVTGDLEAAKDLLATGIFATPLLIVGGEKVIGYRPDKLAVALIGESSQGS